MTPAVLTPTVIVRDATPGDLDRLVEMGRAFLHSTAYEHRIAEDATHIRSVMLTLLSAGRIFLAIEGSHVIGMLGGIVIPHFLLNQRVGSEVIWWVDENARRGGAGAALKNVFEAWARAEGATRVQFTAYRDLVLERLYRRMGYHAHEVVYEKEL